MALHKLTLFRTEGHHMALRIPEDQRLALMAGLVAAAVGGAVQRIFLLLQIIDLHGGNIDVVPLQLTGQLQIEGAVSPLLHLGEELGIDAFFVQMADLGGNIVLLHQPVGVHIGVIRVADGFKTGDQRSKQRQISGQFLQPLLGLSAQMGADAVGVLGIQQMAGIQRQGVEGIQMGELADKIGIGQIFQFLCIVVLQLLEMILIIACQSGKIIFFDLGTQVIVVFFAVGIDFRTEQHADITAHASGTIDDSMGRDLVQHGLPGICAQLLTVAADCGILQ